MGCDRDVYHGGDYLFCARVTMYDVEESQAECAAYEQRYQQALDLLYYVGCQYSIKDKDMRLLCDHMGVHWDDLQTHKGKPAAH